MNKLLSETLATQTHRIETRDVQVEVEELPNVMTDQMAMEQIISNLLDNALKYLDPSRPGRISVSADHVGAETRFQIQDNGVGIAQDQLKSVFKIFRRLGSDKIPGEGVGLSYVQANVRRLDGRIWCHSKVGSGSTFIFTIPDATSSGNTILSTAYTASLQGP
jgi:signal transduction histidine kinase